MKRKPGFTLVELLFVIAILGVLFALFLPVINDIQWKLEQLNCQANLRDIGNVLHAYAARHAGELPAFDMGFGDAYHGDSGLIKDKKEPLNRHLMLEELISLGATPRTFSCPAHERVKLGHVDDPGSFWGWAPGTAVQARGKFYHTLGYVIFTYQPDFGGPNSPNMRLGSFPDGRPLARTSDASGNPPLAADVMARSYHGATYYGFWHDPDREPLRPNVYGDVDAACVEPGGGGSTLFLGGEIIWVDWSELNEDEPGYTFGWASSESHKVRNYYFATDPSQQDL